jgi:hypothetical protein
MTEPGAAAKVGSGAFVGAVLLYVALVLPLPFYNKGEPREALVVRGLVAGEGFWLPRRDGHEMSSKPPLFHWLAAAALAGGVRPEELAVRLPSILAGAGAVALTAAVATRWHGAVTGVLAAAVLATASEWLHAAMQARVDMVLTLLVTGAVLAGGAVLAAVGRGRALIRLGYFLTALAVLTKGPVGAVLPVLVITTGALATGRGRRLGRLLDPLGISLAVLVCGGWYVGAYADGGAAFVARQIVHENIDRFLGGGGKTAHAQPVYYYLPMLLVAALPWSFALPAALRDAWRARTTADRFCGAWIASVLVFYSLAAGKRAAYLLPLLPPLGILIGRHLARVVTSGLGPLGRWLTLGLATASAATAVGLAVGWGDEAGDFIAAWLTPREQRSAAAVIELLASQVAPIASGAALLAALLALLAGLAARAREGAAARTGIRTALVCALAVAWACGRTALVTYPVAVATTQRPFAEQVTRVADEDDVLWFHGYVDYGFRYYLGRPLRAWGERRGREAVRGRAAADASAENRGNARHGATDQREFMVVAVTVRDAGLMRRGLRTRLVDPRAYVTDRLELCEVRGEAMAVPGADTAGVEAGRVGGE